MSISVNQSSNQYITEKFHNFIDILCRYDSNLFYEDFNIDIDIYEFLFDEMRFFDIKFKDYGLDSCSGDYFTIEENNDEEYDQRDEIHYKNQYFKVIRHKYDDELENFIPGTRYKERYEKFMKMLSSKNIYEPLQF